MKKLVKFGLVALVLLVAVGWGLIRYLGSANAEFVKKWIGGQLQTVANWYLNPKLSFEYLDYQYPKTVVLTKMKLTADDPRNAGQKIDVIAADKITLELAELPRVGKPLLIEKIILDHPAIRAVAVEPKSAQFVGLSNLVKSTGEKQEAAKTQGGQPSGTKLSEVFQIRLLQLIEGQIVYDPRIEGTQAMVLDQINTRLDITPTADGWYKVAANMGRLPVFELKTAGEVNLDSLDTRAIDITVQARLDEKGNKSLPPQIQDLLKQHEITGNLDVKIVGALPVRDYLRGDMKADIKLSDAHMALGDYQLGIKQLMIPAVLKDRKASLQPLELQALDGSLQVKGVLELDEPMNTNVTLTIADMVAERMLRKTPEGNQPPPFAGHVNATIDVINAPLSEIILLATPPSTQPSTQPSSQPSTAPVTEVATATTSPTTGPTSRPAIPEFWGAGTIKIDRAELGRIPVLSDLFAGFSKGLMVLGGGDAKDYHPTDIVDLQFDLNGKYVNFKKLLVSKPVVGISGTGNVGIDRTINLTLKLSPPEKNASGFAGTIGQVTGSVMGGLMSAKVGGTFDEPKIEIKPFNLDTGDAGKAVGAVGEGATNVGKAVGEGVKDVGKGIGDGIKGIFGGEKK